MCPIHDVLEFRPVIHLFEWQLFDWRTGDDQTIKFPASHLGKGTVMIDQMLRGGIF